MQAYRAIVAIVMKDKRGTHGTASCAGGNGGVKCFYKERERNISRKR